MNRVPSPGVAYLYTNYLPKIREIGQKCGYAIAVHGSMTADLDLVAVPWVYNALPAETLVARIVKAVGGFVDGPGTTVYSPSPEKKPHYRQGWSIFLSSDFTGPYIDISVTPRIDYESKKVIEGKDKSK